MQTISYNLLGVVLLRGSSQIIRCWSGTREPETAQRQKTATDPNGARRRNRRIFDSYFCEIKQQSTGILTVSPLVSLCLSLAGDLPLQEGMHCSDRIRHVFVVNLTEERFNQRTGYR